MAWRKQFCRQCAVNRAPFFRAAQRRKWCARSRSAAAAAGTKSPCAPFLLTQARQHSLVDPPRPDARTVHALLRLEAAQRTAGDDRHEDQAQDAQRRGL